MKHSFTNIYLLAVLVSVLDATPLPQLRDPIDIIELPESEGRDALGQPIIVDRRQASDFAPEIPAGRDEFGQPIVVDRRQATQVVEIPAPNPTQVVEIPAPNPTQVVQIRQASEGGVQQPEATQIVPVVDPTQVAQRPQETQVIRDRDNLIENMVITETRSVAETRRFEDEFGQPQVVPDPETPRFQDLLGQPQRIPDRRQVPGPAASAIAENPAQASSQASPPTERPFDVVHNADGSVNINFPNDRVPTGGETIYINDRIITLPSPSVIATSTPSVTRRSPQTSIIFNTDSLFDIDLPKELISFGDDVQVLDPAGNPIPSDNLPPWIAVGNANAAPLRVAKRTPQTTTFDRPPVDIVVNEPVIRIETGSDPSVSFNGDGISVTLEPPRLSRRQNTDPVNENIGGGGTTIVFNDETIDIEFNAPFVQIN